MSNYKVTVMPDVDNRIGDKITMTFPTIDMARAAHGSMADLLLFLQDKIKVMPDSSNMLFIEKMNDDGEWEEGED